MKNNNNDNNNKIINNLLLYSIDKLYNITLYTKNYIKNVNYRKLKLFISLTLRMR